MATNSQDSKVVATETLTEQKEKKIEEPEKENTNQTETKLNNEREITIGKKVDKKERKMTTVNTLEAKMDKTLDKLKRMDKDNKEIKNKIEQTAANTSNPERKLS